MKSIDVKFLSIFLISLLGFFVYSNTFYSSFHFDDINYIVKNPAIKNIHTAKPIAAGALPDKSNIPIAGTATKKMPKTGMSEATMETAPHSTGFGNPKMAKRLKW